MRARVLRLVTDEGVTTEGISRKLGSQWTMVQKAMAYLAASGQVKKAKIGHKTVWYFLTQEAADAFAAKKSKRAATPPNVEVVKTKTSFEKGAQIIVPQGVKVQECPPFRGLGFSETQPKERAFSSLGVGRYLPDEDAMLRRVARKGA